MSNSSESIPESNSVGGSTYGDEAETGRNMKSYEQRPKMMRRKRKYDHFLPPRTEMVRICPVIAENFNRRSEKMKFLNLGCCINKKVGM